MTKIFQSAELDALYSVIPNIADFDKSFWIRDGQVRLRDSRIGIDFLYEDTFGEIIAPELLAEMYEHLPTSIIAKAWEWCVENQEWTRRYMIELDRLSEHHRKTAIDRSDAGLRTVSQKHIVAERSESRK